MSERSVAAAQNDDLVAALARATVERAAPEELPLFRATSEAYLRDPASVEGGKSRDELLGFGVEAAAMLVTPVALQVVEVLRRDGDAIHLLRQQIVDDPLLLGGGAV